MRVSATQGRIARLRNRRRSGCRRAKSCIPNVRGDFEGEQVGWGGGGRRRRRVSTRVRPGLYIFNSRTTLNPA